jgi:uncharacterized membrane-anchored protein
MSADERLTAPPAASRRDAVRSVKVPQIVAAFWVAKALTTALGESTSDYLVHLMPPVLAVVLGFVAFCVALALQFRTRRYVAWRYWTAVSMVGIFGTMAADVVHVGFGVPYAVSAPVFAVALAAVFAVWHRCEGTLSIHRVDSVRRESFYWAAVVATFALGTALGDLTATTLGLGYLASAVLFAVLICVPAAGRFVFRADAVLTFWMAYVLTRPLGASLADWAGKPTRNGGLGIGPGLVSVVLAAAVLACIAYFQASRADQP